MPGTKLNSMLKSTNQMERDMAIGHLIASHGMVFMSPLLHKMDMSKVEILSLVVKEMLNL